MAEYQVFLLVYIFQIFHSEHNINVNTSRSSSALTRSNQSCWFLPCTLPSLYKRLVNSESSTTIENSKQCELLSHVRLFGSPWIQPARLLCPWDFPGKNAGVGCHSLLQGIFPTQGLILGLRHNRQILNHLSHHESPLKKTCYTPSLPPQ